MSPYNILGVKPGTSKDDIKKAYRKLAMKHHPDKGGDSEEFKKISSAYQQLTNDDPFESFPEIAEIFKMFGLGSFQEIIGSQGINLQSLMMPRGPTISTALGLTLEELEKGGEFEVKYSRRIPTGKVIQENHQTPFGLMQMMAPEDVEKIYTTKIKVPPCHDERKILNFPHRATGDNVSPGNLEVRLVVHPHKTLKRVGALDLKVDLDVTLKEALTGFVREIELLNNEEPLKIECDSVVNPYDTKRIKGSGMNDGTNRGDLILGFKIQFPVILEAESKETLKKLVDL